MTISEQDLGRISGLIQTGGGVYSGGGKVYTPKYDSMGGLTYEVSDAQSGVNVATPSNSETYNKNVEYSRIPASSLSENDIASSVAVPKPDEAKIREEEIARQKNRIDAINQAKDIEATRERRAGQEREIGLRALSGMFGWQGSPTAFGQREGERTKTRENLSYIEKLRNIELQGVFDKIDENVKQLYEAELAQNKEEQQAIIKKSKEAGDAALAGLAYSFGNKGVDYETLKKTDSSGELEKIRKLLGYSDYQMEQAYNSALPENLRPSTQISYHANQNGNTVMNVFSYNPLTNKSSVKEYEMGVPFAAFRKDDLLKGANGEIYMLQKQDDGSMKAVEVTPGKAIELNKGATLVDPNTGNVIARGQSDTPKEEPFVKLDNEAKTTLLGSGLSEDRIKYIANGIMEYGLDEVLKNEDLTAAQEAALKGVYGGGKILNFAAIKQAANSAKPEDVKNYLLAIYDEDELKDLADEAEVSGFFSRKSTDIDNYINSPAGRTEYANLLKKAYEAQGYTIEGDVNSQSVQPPEQ